MYKKILTILMVTLFVAGLGFAGERVLTVGGGSASRPLVDFAMMATGLSDTYYVDSSTGDNNHSGKSAKRALATLDAAVGKCTANQGDIIYVLSGHAESLAAADAVDVDVAGVTIIGLGDGEDMPEFTFSATSGEFVVGADSVTVKNLRFIAGISDVVMGISVEAAGDNFTLEDCVFPKPSTATFEFLDAIDIADGANYITVKGCEYYNDEGTAAANHFIEAGNGTAGPEKLQVVDCYIKGNFAVSALWSDEPCDEAFIANNTIINHASGQHCIEFTDSGTGAIVGNKLYGDTEAAILDPGSMYVFGNVLSTAIDNEGIPRWVMDNGIDHLCALDGTTQIYPENAVDDSIIAKLMTKSDPAAVADYDNSTDSLEAIADALTMTTKSAVTSSAIPNNTQTAAIATVTTGGAWLADIIVQTDATGLAGPTNIEISVDNIKGAYTGPDSSIAVELIGSFGGSVTFLKGALDTDNFPVYVEAGKSVYIHGDDGAGTGDGIADVILKFEAGELGATVAGSDVSP